VASCVLVVDDDQDIREAVVEAISDAGYTVAAAANGREALDAMRANRPCVVVLDLMMPVMDGWEVVAQMDLDPTLAGVPVCVVSAHDKDPPRNDAMLRKPVSLARLLAAIEQYCGCP
jgi:CheY-like chemotaxis protein